MDKAYWGQDAHWGNFRWGVYIPDWDNKVLPSLKKIDGSDIWTKMLRKMKSR